MLQLSYVIDCELLVTFRCTYYLYGNCYKNSNSICVFRIFAIKHNNMIKTIKAHGKRTTFTLLRIFIIDFSLNFNKLTTRSPRHRRWMPTSPIPYLLYNKSLILAEHVEVTWLQGKGPISIWIHWWQMLGILLNVTTNDYN